MIGGNAPVLVGIGLAAQREDDAARAVDALALMTRATLAAGQDCGNPALLRQLDRILVPKGRWSHTDPARDIARSVGADGAVTVLSTVGVLQQSLIADACNRIADGQIGAALVTGGDAGYRILRSRIAGVQLPSPPPGGAPDVTLAPHEELRHEAELRADLRMPVSLYAIIESAFRARHGWAMDAHRDQLAALYSRFSAVAAANPAAWTRQRLNAAEIRTESQRNPMQAFPYTKALCSSWNVDQAAALLFCSASKAEELGIPPDRWVFPWASTESNHMVPVSARGQLDACPGARIAGQAATEPFGLTPADLGLVDLYSCFPVAVEVYASELGLDMERDLTVTGGMPFAGGPYNNYVLQATCRMAELLRAGDPRPGLVASVSGILTKQGFGLWSTRPPQGGYRFADVSDAVARITSTVAVDPDASGAGSVVGYCVLHDRAVPPRGIAVIDLDGGGRAVATSADAEPMERMQREECCGMRVDVRAGRFAPSVDQGAAAL